MPSCGGVCERDRLFERSDIEVAWRDRVPLQHMRVGREEVLHIRKYLAQLVEQLAQVIASLGLGSIGPEEKGQMLALLGNIAMQHEIGEQGAQAHGIEVSHLLVIVEQAEIAKQAEVKGWYRHDLLPFSSSGSSNAREGRVASSGNMCMTSRKSSKPYTDDAFDCLQLSTIVLDTLTLPYHSLFYHYQLMITYTKPISIVDMEVLHDDISYEEENEEDYA